MGGHEYGLATLWQRLSFKFILIGFELVILAFASNLGGEDHVEVEVLILLGFVCYLLALIFVIFLIWLSEQVERHPMMWTTGAMIFSFLSAALLLAGISVEGARYNDLKPYSTTFIAASSGMSLLGGFWLAVELKSHVG